MPLRDPVQHRAINNYMQRLLRGVSRSPALKAFPTRSVRRIDLARFRLASDRAPDEIVRGVIDRGSRLVEFQTYPRDDPRTIESQTLFTNLKTKLSREAQAAHRETGLWMLWLAYPLLFAPNPSPDRRDSLLAPLFLWPIRIESIGLREHQLLIARQDESPLFNRVALQWIRRVLQFDPGEPTTADLLGIADFDGVVGLVHRICSAFTPSLPVRLGPSIAPVPKRQDLETEAKPRLLDSGVLGLIRWENMELLADLERLGQKEQIDGPAADIIRQGEPVERTPTPEPPEADRYLVTRTDLSQERAVWKARDGQGVVVHGPPGTGKSQVIVNIVADYLARSKTVLVVCQKKAALDVVASRLKAAGLGDLLMQVDDVEGDRRRIIESLRNQIVPVTEPTAARSRLTEEIERLEADFATYARALFAVQEQHGVSYQTLLARIARIERRLPEVRPNPAVRFLSRDATAAELAPLIEKLATLEDLFSKAQIHQNPWCRYGKNLRSDRYSLDELRASVAAVLVHAPIVDKWAGLSAPECGELVGDVPALASAAKLLAAHAPRLSNELSRARPGPDVVQILDDAYSGAAVAATHFAASETQMFRWLSWPFHRARVTLARFGATRSWVRAAHASDHLRSLAERADAVGRFLTALPGLEQWLIPSLCRAIRNDARTAKPVNPLLLELDRFIERIPDLLRYRALLGSLDDRALAIVQAIIPSEGPPPSAWATIVELSASLEWAAQSEDKNPILRAKSAELYEAESKRLRVLAERKQALEPALIRNRWSEKWSSVDHRWRNGLRFRGRSASRLREIIEHGRERGVLTLRPCWLANPGAVSQAFPLEPGLFDLVIFDEASQCPPEYALPSLYRGKAMVVAGDNKQLPPTMFFRSAFDFEEEDGELQDNELERDVDGEADLAVAAGAEDLLSLAQARVPPAHLNVHYRSLDPSLIAFSNAAFYGNRLEVPQPPSPIVADGKPALQLRQVNGIYETSRTNPSEAREIVAYLKALWRSTPQLPTVGVVTFNDAQREALEDLLDAEGSRDPAFRAAYEHELTRVVDGQDVGFFVKSLEAVQGDERDVILFSTTYGKRLDGHFRRSFLGPINQAGGERRLNVAVTRAKRWVRVFTSIPIAELANALAPGAVETPDAAGRAMLQLYLAYADRLSRGDHSGAAAVLGRALQIGGQAVGDARSIGLEESEFEIEVREALHDALGLRIDSQVSSGSFRIDLAVRSPLADAYILGIECDGKAYHSAPSARAYDHWRQDLLEERGWQIHRIWSTSWRDARQEEIARVERRVGELLRLHREPSSDRPPVVLEAQSLAPLPNAATVATAPEPAPIGIGTNVEFEFDDSPGEVRTATIVLGERIPGEGELRAGSPLGRALIGKRSGDTTVLALDGGRRRTIRILKITQP